MPHLLVSVFLFNERDVHNSSCLVVGSPVSLCRSDDIRLVFLIYSLTTVIRNRHISSSASVPLVVLDGQERHADDFYH